MFQSDLSDAGHVRRLTEEVYRKDRPCSWRDRCFDLLHIDVEGLRIDIYIDRLPPQERNRLRGRGKSEWSCDYLIAGLQVHRHECKLQRIGARSTRDRVLHAKIALHRALETGNVWTINVFAAPHDLEDRTIDLVLITM